MALTLSYKLFIPSCSYRVFSLKSSSKMIQEQAAAAVIIGLIFEKNKSRKKRTKRRVCVKPQLKRRKNLEFYETVEFYKILLAELRLGDVYNYNILLQMASENFEEIFQLIRPYN